MKNIKKALWRVMWAITITLSLPLILIVFSIIFYTESETYELGPYWPFIWELILWCYSFEYEDVVG